MTDSQATLIAALIAAGLSAATLVTTVLVERVRLRTAKTSETTKWLRDTLHRAAFEYLEEAYAISSVCRQCHRDRGAGRTAPEIQILLDAARAAHNRMSDALTALRLLAPYELLEAAERLYNSHHAFIDTAFHAPSVGTGDGFVEARSEARRTRSDFVRAARVPLGLDDRLPEIGIHAAPPWVFTPAP